MKTAGPHLVLLFMAGTLEAQDATAASDAAAKTSARLRQEITTFLPKYAPPPPPTAVPKPNVAADSDPNVLSLPTFTVKEYRPRDHDPDVWLTRKGAKEKALTLYQRSLTDLEWALNSWYIPLVGTSPAARAQASYKAAKSLEESRRIHRLFDLVSINDTQAARELERERVKMEQTEHWQGRPAGHGRTK
jgi:hypothetical protein